MASFDDLAFDRACGAADAQHGFCYACARTYPLDRLCPTCGMPLRRLTAQQHGALRVILDGHARVGASRRAVDSDDDEETPAHARLQAHVAATLQSGPQDFAGLMSEMLGAEAAPPELRALAALQALGPLAESLDGMLDVVNDGTPASAAAVAALPRVTVLSSESAVQQLSRSAELLVEVVPEDVERVAAGTPRTHTCTATHAVFGPRADAASSIGDVSTRPFVLAEPVEATHALRSSTTVRGACVLASRGAVSFAAKALNAQAAGAVAVVVMQTSDEWPMEMADAGRDAEKSELGAPLRIPSVMVSKPDGHRLAAMARAGARLRARIRSVPAADSCSVCVEAWAPSEVVVRLPCDHLFHDRCLQPWVKRKHTCPLCRFALPQADEAEVMAARVAASSTEQDPRRLAAAQQAAAQLGAALRDARAAAAKARQLAAERTAIAETWYA